MNGREKACQTASTGRDSAAPVSGTGPEPPRRERGTQGALSPRSGSTESAGAGGRVGVSASFRQEPRLLPATGLPDKGQRAWRQPGAPV